MEGTCRCWYMTPHVVSGSRISSLVCLSTPSHMATFPHGLRLRADVLKTKTKTKRKPQEAPKHMRIMRIVRLSYTDRYPPPSHCPTRTKGPLNHRNKLWRLTLTFYFIGRGGVWGLRLHTYRPLSLAATQRPLGHWHPGPTATRPRHRAHMPALAPWPHHSSGACGQHCPSTACAGS